MGEYASYRGQSVKIGTCEDMYYLRYDQRYHVQHKSGNVDPVHDAGDLRFRFPWPDEDHLTPGSNTFHDNGYHRGVSIDGFGAIEGLEHSRIQFRHDAGYLTCLPCPEDPAHYTTDSRMVSQLVTTGPLPEPIIIHRNGFNGYPQLVSQKFRPTIGLVPILRCGSCHSMARIEERPEIERLAMCFRSMADREEHSGGRPVFYQTIADRILAGIAEGVPQ